MGLIHKVFPDIRRIGISPKIIHFLINVHTDPHGCRIIRRIAAKPSIYIVGCCSRFTGHRHIHIKGTSSGRSAAVGDAAFQNVRHHPGRIGGINLFLLSVVRHENIFFCVHNLYDTGRGTIFSIVGQRRIACRHFHCCGSFRKTTQTGRIILVISFLQSLKMHIFQIGETIFRSQFLIQTVGGHVTGFLYRLA